MPFWRDFLGRKLPLSPLVEVVCLDSWEGGDDDGKIKFWMRFVQMRGVQAHVPSGARFLAHTGDCMPLLLPFFSQEVGLGTRGEGGVLG